MKMKMDQRINLWIDFLQGSLDIFSPEYSVSVFHSTYTPTPNTSGELVFELNEDFHKFLWYIVDEYLKYSNSQGDNGELDFIFKTIEYHRDFGLSNNRLVVDITEVERVSGEERMAFIYNEISTAVAYIDLFFQSLCNKSGQPRISGFINPWDDPDIILDSIPNFDDGIHARGLGG